MSDDSSNDETLKALDGLIERFEALLDELDIYKARLAEANRTHAVSFGGFETTIKSDLKHLKKLRDAGEAKYANLESLCSSNIPFYETTWNAAKRTTGLVAFKRKFFWRQHSGPSPVQADEIEHAKKNHGVQVDVITENGTQWIKIASLTEKRLLHDIAKEGWGISDSEDDSHDSSDDTKDLNESIGQTSIPVLKLAGDLMKASRANRTRYQFPKVKLILPRMVDRDPQVRKVLDMIRATGCNVELGPQEPDAAPQIENVLPSLMALNENYAALGPTVNVDTTVLLALVSDISHDMADEGSLTHPQQREQARLEQKDQLLPTVLYPATAGRRLVCTREAVAQMRDIVAPIGNTTEKKRTDLLFTEDPDMAPEERAKRRQAFAALSEHEVPESFLMPILIVDKDEACPDQEPVKAGFSPSIAEKIGPKFAEHNASVFIYGWRTGRTTLTSNWTTVKAFEDVIERARLDPSLEKPEEDVSGPGVWFIPLSRSLVGMDHGDKYYGQDRLELYRLQTSGSKDDYKNRRRKRTPGWIEKLAEDGGDGSGEPIAPPATQSQKM